MVTIGKHGARLGLPILGVLTMGCATINYDQQADQQLTSLVQAINQQYITWENQAISSKQKVQYDSKFYDQIESGIASLEVRMEASQDVSTPKLTSAFNQLFAEVESERNQHKQYPLDAPYCHAERLILNVQLAALLTYELSLKGNNSATGSTSGTATAQAQKAAPASKPSLTQ
jgi:hypothetical protein